MITPNEKREQKLLEHGVPIGFLQALEKIDNFPELEFIINNQDSAYYYLDDIYEKYDSINNYDITPIFCGNNNDTFYVLLTNESTIRFVFFELEQDEIYTDYGSNFMPMLVDLLVMYYEFAEDLKIEELKNIGTKMGLKSSNELFNDLENDDWNNEKIYQYS